MDQFAEAPGWIHQGEADDDRDEGGRVPKLVRMPVDRSQVVGVAY